ncbi:MAG: (2Fe-2S) ferredoxin domain-containing protein [Eubacterium sp.]|jgi:NADP-reducing hydrogenase subunit HndB|nr:(2Fe-2S) ferredoxin domain-containing protein [Eubacterium sp.]
MKTLAELQAIKEKMQNQMGMRSENSDNTRVVVGMATCGIAAGARPVLQKISSLISEKGLKNITVSQTGCIGLCQYEPIVEIYEPGGEKTTYIKMDEKKAAEMVEKHLTDGCPIEEYTISASDLAKS